MKRNYRRGEKIALVAMSETGKRLECISVVIDTLEGGPEVKIDSPAFREPPQIELAEMLIEDTENGLRYRGEIAGAILIPNFLWVSP
jgi:hypothetical protein